MNDSWLYSPERMEFRAFVLLSLLQVFGSSRIDEEVYSTEDIYACAHDWVSQGNKTTTGLLGYFCETYIDCHW